MSSPTMRAVTQDSLGGPEVLVVSDRPRPEPRTNEILVRVRAASVNPTDWKHRANGGFLGAPPFVLGWDLSGVVEEVGIGVARFAPGDEVYGMLSYPFGHGAHADYVTAPAAWFAPKPASLDHVQAAALPLVSLTAWQALVEYADIQPGQRVLIHAAAGGVGHVAVQIAKARGAYVIGTASAGKHEFLRELGVDEAIDYREVDFAEAVGDVDAVLDTLGGDTSSRSLRTLRPGGILVSILPVGSDDLLREADDLGVRAIRMLVDSSRHDLLSVTDLVDRGALRARVSDVFPLEQAAEAHRRGETGRTTGKMVLTLD
ncbi:MULTISPECIES: NADP-dependent oxidoreductase [unclassified Dietzia]|uniref:NADP-dependent oxidoreductase n=1 Tax=unclassified Dietzia TaxID=2617939 RepID=UPI0015FA637B|nr:MULTISPECIES: NADP-dependent oxidoreductase [unclassified Dietzia]MBB1025978.1 NADP-dependent oxidoreductase [Dietzia sp. DQ12-76]MBB1027329.1 NADP-dependent oxidoreductase [Dietzia sp. DQ11-38-2]